VKIAYALVNLANCAATECGMPDPVAWALSILGIILLALFIGIWKAGRR
jgi:hypothetical protein